MAIAKYSDVNPSDIIAQLLSRGGLTDGMAIRVINNGTAVEFQVIASAGNVSTAGLTIGQLPVAVAATVLGDSGIDAADVIIALLAGTPGKVAVFGATGMDIVDGPVAANLVTANSAGTPGQVAVFGATGRDLVDGGAPGGGLLLKVTRVFTNAEVLALPTTGATLVAAPATGNFYLPVFIMITTKVAGAWTNVDVNARLQVAVGNGTSGFMGCDIDVAVVDAALLTTNNRRWNTQTPKDQGAVGSATAPDNEPIRLRLGNGGSGNLTGGNAANSMQVTVWYLAVAWQG